MKIKLFLALILTFAVGALVTVEAQPRQQEKVKINTQKKFTRSKLTVKFVELVEDSRCPKDANCVWAGNAKIKIEVSKNGRNKQTFEINSNMGAKGATYDGYQIELVDLTPFPASNIRIDRNGYVATFAIVRQQR